MIFTKADQVDECQHKADGLGCNGSRRNPRKLHQRAQPRTARFVDTDQPLQNQHVIFAQQRDHVRDGSQSNQIQQFSLIERKLGRGKGNLLIRAQQRLGELVSDAHTRQVFKGVSAVGTPGIDHRIRLG